MHMTPEQFFEYIGEAKYYTAKGKSRLNVIRGRYSDYVRLYKARSVQEISSAARNHYGSWSAISRAAKDRDEGKPMVVVLEFLDVLGPKYAKDVQSESTVGVSEVKTEVRPL